MRATHSSRLIAASACFVLGMAICRAKLGDTEARCVARYGPEFDVQQNLGFDVVGDKAASFNFKVRKNALVMHVIFLNGVAGVEKITNADASRDLSDDEKQAILNSESAGFTWSKQSTHYRSDGGSDNTSAMEKWQRSDGATTVCWMSGKLTFEHGWGEIDLTTRPYAQAQHDLDRQN